MKTLLVLANPSQTSFSHQMMEAFCKNNPNQTIEILDLYNDKLQNFGEFDLEVQKYHQDKITWAEQIVFFAPIWWGNFPAILKNWIDVNFSSGFAYKYVDHKAVGLLKGKTAKIFVSCDGPALIYWLLGIPAVWKFVVFGFSGINLSKVSIYGNKRHKTAEQNQKHLDSIK